MADFVGKSSGAKPMILGDFREKAALSRGREKDSKSRGPRGHGGSTPPFGTLSQLDLRLSLKFALSNLITGLITKFSSLAIADRRFFGARYA